MRTAGEMRTLAEESAPMHVGIVAGLIRQEAEAAVEDAARYGLRYAEIRRPVRLGSVVYHWAVAAFDRVVEELKAKGYTTELNTRPAPRHPAQQYDPYHDNDTVLALTIKW